jgi:hypothetical protein
MRNPKAYILIDVADGRANEILAMLQGQPSITKIECVEGPPDIVMVVEADEIQKLAELTIKALTKVEHLTGSIRCLPVSHKGIESVKVQNETGCRVKL